MAVRIQEPAIKTQALPAGTASLQIVLTGTQLESPFSVVLTSSQIVNDQAVFSISNLPPGTYSLDVVALDGSGNTLASGHATLSITSGAVLPVYLLLSPPQAGDPGVQGDLAISIETAPVAESPTTSYPTGAVAATVS